MQGKEDRPLSIHLHVELQCNKHHFAKPSVVLIGPGRHGSCPWDRASRYGPLQVLMAAVDVRLVYIIMYIFSFSSLEECLPC